MNNQSQNQNEENDQWTVRWEKNGETCYPRKPAPVTREVADEALERLAVYGWTGTIIPFSQYLVESEVSERKLESPLANEFHR